MVRYIRIALVLLVLLSICSCFSYSQEIWINADGSGRLKLDLGLGKALLGMGMLSEQEDPLAQTRQDFEKVKTQLEANPEVKRVKFEDFAEGDVHHFTMDIEVKDYRKLTEIDKLAQPKPGKAMGSMGLARGAPFKLTQGKAGRINFSQDLSFGVPKSAEGGKDEEMAQMMAAQLMSNYYYSVTVHAPRIGETNGEVAKDKRSVSWKIPMGELVSGSYNRELTAELRMPSLNPLVLIAEVGGVLIFLLAVVIARRKRMQHQSAPPAPPLDTAPPAPPVDTAPPQSP